MAHQARSLSVRALPPGRARITATSEDGVVDAEELSHRHFVGTVLELLVVDLHHGGQESVVGVDEHREQLRGVVAVAPVDEVPDQCEVADGSDGAVEIRCHPGSVRGRSVRVGVDLHSGAGLGSAWGRPVDEGAGRGQA